jgi:hypothetical protein
MFYTYRQSNSGGYYHINDMVAEYVIIEAMDEDAASEKLSEVIKNYYWGCGCGTCSERWSYYVDNDGDNEPSIQNIPAADYRHKGWFDEDDKRTVVVYYTFGNKEYIHYKGELLSPIKAVKQ